MLLKRLAVLLCFVGGSFLGFLVYCVCVAYLIEENLPNPAIAQGFVENFKMILLIGSLRIGELEEYFTPILITLIFGLLTAYLPLLWRPKHWNLSNSQSTPSEELKAEGK
tara:strand:+ start:72 stop:401 length:330 start_codon:yes stop_codon:yes gene_type:complete